MSDDRQPLGRDKVSKIVTILRDCVTVGQELLIHFVKVENGRVASTPMHQKVRVEKVLHHAIDFINVDEFTRQVSNPWRCPPDPSVGIAILEVEIPKTASDLAAEQARSECDENGDATPPGRPSVINRSLYRKKLKQEVVRQIQAAQEDSREEQKIADALRAQLKQQREELEQQRQNVMMMHQQEQTQLAELHA